MRRATPKVVPESRIADLDRYSPGQHDVLAERSAESTRYRIQQPFPPGPPTSVEAPAGPASSLSAKKGRLRIYAGAETRRRRQHPRPQPWRAGSAAPFKDPSTVHAPTDPARLPAA